MDPNNYFDPAEVAQSRAQYAKRTPGNGFLGAFQDPMSRGVPEDIANKYALGEPDYLQNLRHQAYARMSAGAPQYEQAAQGEYQKAMQGVPGQGLGGGAATPQLDQARAEARLRSASAQNAVRGQGTAQEFASQDWNMRQAALKEFIRQREWNLINDKGEENFQKSKNMVNTMLSFMGLGGKVAQGMQHHENVQPDKYGNY